MDIAQLTQAPRELMLAGEPFMVRALKAREWGLLHQFIKDHAEDPIAVAVRQIDRMKRAEAPVTPEQEDFLLSAAREEARSWPPRASSSAWFELLGDLDGGDLEFLLVAIRTGRPEFTRDQAEALAGRMQAAESSALILAALGIDPSPKAPTPPPAAAGKRRPSPTGTTGRPRSTR